MGPKGYFLSLPLIYRMSKIKFVCDFRARFRVTSDNDSGIRVYIWSDIGYPTDTGHPVSISGIRDIIGYGYRVSDQAIRISNRYPDIFRLLFEHFGRTDSQEISIPLSSLGTIPRQRWQLSRAQCIYSFIKKKLFASLLSYHIVGAHLIGKIYS